MRMTTTNEFMRMVTEAREKIFSPHSETREEGFRQLHSSTFPGCGRLNGSRKQRDKLCAVPVDILDQLILAAQLREIELRAHVAEFIKARADENGV